MLSPGFEKVYKQKSQASKDFWVQIFGSLKEGRYIMVQRYVIKEKDCMPHHWDYV
jgi:hypothetical protein